MSGEQLDRVRALCREGRYDEAVIHLESLLAKHPNHPTALLELARCQLRRGRVESALAELTRAEMAGGVTARSAVLRGEVLQRLGRHREGERAYVEAEALGDRAPWTLVQMGRCRLKLEDIEGARGSALRAAEHDPGFGPAWALLGDVAIHTGDIAGAEAMFEKAHGLSPDNQYVYARLIEARLLQLPPEERGREVEVVLRSKGRDNHHLLAVLARLQSQLGDQVAAARAWHQSRAGGDDRFARKMEGYALRKAGKLEDAARLLRESLLREPEDLILFRTYVHLQRQRGAEEELRQTLEELIPLAGSRKGAVYGELRKLGEPR